MPQSSNCAGVSIHCPAQSQTHISGTPSLSESTQLHCWPINDSSKPPPCSTFSQYILPPNCVNSLFSIEYAQLHSIQPSSPEVGLTFTE